MDAGHGRAEDKPRRPVPVRHGVHRILRDPAEAQVSGKRVSVDIEGAPRQGPRSERQNVTLAEHGPQVLQVAHQGPRARQKPLRCRHRLSLLEVGVAGHDDACRLTRLRGDHTDQVGQIRPQRLDRLLAPQAEIGRHLIVARAAGMELSAGRADRLREQPLDDRVDIFVGQILRSGQVLQPAGHGDEPLVDQGRFVRRYDPRPPQAARPRPAALDVVAPETPIHLQRPVQRLHLVGQDTLESPPPEGMARRIAPHVHGAGCQSRSVSRSAKSAGTPPGRSTRRRAIRSSSVRRWRAAAD